MHGACLSQLSFGAPWILAALVVLPVIWWLLRVTPPQPRRIVFPPLRLLLGLQGRRTDAGAHALVAAAAAPDRGGAADRGAGRSAARPRAARSPGNGPLVLLVDNGWTAAENWDAAPGA